MFLFIFVIFVYAYFVCLSFIKQVLTCEIKIKYILLWQRAHVFDHYCHHCVTNISQCNSINRNRKKLNKIHYKNHEIWPGPGVFLFFSSTESCVVLILFLYFCLSYNICQNFVHQLLKLHLTFQISYLFIFIC